MQFLQQTLSRGLLIFALSPFGTTQDALLPASQDPSELLQRGQALAEANRLAEAETTLEMAAGQRGVDPRLVTLLAEVKSRLGERVEAVALFRRVAIAQPKSSVAHLYFAIALADDGQTQEALKELNDAMRLDPRSSQIHLNRARVLADLQRPVEARTEFSRAKLLAPANPAVDYFWGAFEKDNRRPAVAVSLLTRVTVLQPDNVRAFVLLGQAEQLVGHKQQAIVAWRKAIKLDPSIQETVYALSQAVRESNPDEAAELMLQFESLHAASQKLERVRELGNQAYSAMQQEKWDSAVSILNGAIDLCGVCSLQADLHQRLGLAECHRGDLEAGERELRLAQSLNPNDRETLNALQWVALQKR
jgi:Flp pilus assembly protein TadD